jgi:ankyrin repeat protein
MSDDDNRLLFDAITNNDIETATILIARGFVNGSLYRRPLVDAAANGRLEIMTLLLDAGARINAYDARRKSPCHIAIQNGQLAALQLLVSRGADLSRVDDNNCSLFDIATFQSDDRFVLFLLGLGLPTDRSSLVRAAAKSRAALDRLLALGVNVCELRDTFNRTACHAVRADNPDFEGILRQLVSLGLDVDAADHSGCTPLLCVASSIVVSEKALRVLIELGADVNRRDRWGQTALHLISSHPNGKATHVETLLAAGADPLLVSDSGATSCHRAISLKRSAILCMLLAAGGDLDQPDKNGAKASEIAAHHCFALPTVVEIDAARQSIARTRLDLVRYRALEICIGLQPLNLDALQVCEILTHSFGALGSLIGFHQWWAIATKVKHFLPQE